MIFIFELRKNNYSADDIVVMGQARGYDIKYNMVYELLRQEGFAPLFRRSISNRMYFSIRDKRYKYIRNFYPDLPNSPPADALSSMTSKSMLDLKEKGELDEFQMNVFISPTPADCSPPVQGYFSV